MPFNTGGIPIIGDKIKDLEKQIMSALDACYKACEKTTSDATFNKWFGDASPAFKKQIARNVSKMRSTLNTVSIPCQPVSGLGADNNAMANHFTVGSANVGSLSSLQVVNMLTTQSAQFGTIKIGPNFKNLPDVFAAGIAWNGQSKFETLVHELSHIVIGTKDEKLANGHTAYTVANALLLVTESAAKAKTNAENWGLIVEEFRA
jgi:hypothetical protein